MADQEKPDQDGPNIETDERFPSGPWKGFFLQPEVFASRCRMSLTLTFSENKIQGYGSDVVGKFVMTGRYDLDSGECWITKSYRTGHDIVYKGYNEEGKGIWGTWEILDFFGRMSGGWHIWPAGMADPTGSTLHAECEEPRRETISLEESGLHDSQAELIEVGKNLTRKAGLCRLLTGTGPTNAFHSTPF
jgi:hypothetical protein